MGRTAKTSMSLDRAVLDEARELGINVSRAAESGIQRAIQMRRAEIWKQENAGAIADYNGMIEREGVPLSRYRKF